MMSEFKPNSKQAQAKGPSWRWPVIVVGLLLAHVVGMVSAVTFISHRTRTLGVVENYYDEAVRWDEHRAIVRASAELGWQVKIDPATTIDEFGKRVVTFTLADRDGRPVKDATLEITCAHPAHADSPVKEKFTADDKGVVAQPLSMKYEGFYDFTVTAKAGGKTFLSTQTQWVATEHVTKGAM